MFKYFPENWQYSLAGFVLAQVLGVISLGVGVTTEDAGDRLFIAAIVLSATGLALFVVALARSLRLIRGSLLGSGRRRLKVGTHTYEWAASEEDVLGAHRFLSNLMPKDPPSKTLMLAVFEQNPNTVLLVRSEQSGTSKLVGVTMVVPLTRSAVRAIESISLVDETHADIRGHVCKTWRNPAGIYIGAVGGSSPRGKAWALCLTEALVADSGVTRVYARPASAEGHRVMKSVGFSKLPDPSNYWSVRTAA